MGRDADRGALAVGHRICNRAIGGESSERATDGVKSGQGGHLCAGVPRAEQRRGASDETAQSRGS